MSCRAENSWPLWRYQSFRVHRDRGRICVGVAAVLKSRYFMVVEPDKSFTTLSSPRWQLDNNFSVLSPYCHFFSFNIYPLNLSHPVLPLSALLCHSGLRLSPPFYFYCCLLPLSKVVLLDTTTVLGELDWKTYPVNGVSEKSVFLLSAYLKLNLSS